MKKAIISLLVAGAVTVANAQDKALLETLVKKGMLTQQEAAQIAKESVAVTPSTKSTKSIKIFGGGQGWYTWQDFSNKSGGAAGPQTSGFTLRYVKLGIEADVGGGWSATVVTDFGTEGDTRNYLDKVVASKKIDYDYITGTLELGLRKSNMGYEQNMDDFNQLAIERSIATMFFTRPDYNGIGSKNFGSRSVGVFWDGNIIQVDGLYYSLAATSEVTEGGDGLINNVGDSSSLSFYAAIGYKNVADVKGETISYDFGINFGYAPQGMVSDLGGANERRGSIWGINPYATANWRGLTVIGEFFLQQIEDYKDYPDTGSCRTALGANFTAAYKVDIGEWGAVEPVFRVAYVNANGAHVYIDGAGDDPTKEYFTQAATLYFGVNWYAAEAVKTSLGYEFGYFDNADKRVGDGDNRFYGNTVRAQVQVLF